MASPQHVRRKPALPNSVYNNASQRKNFACSRDRASSASAGHLGAENQSQELVSNNMSLIRLEISQVLKQVMDLREEVAALQEADSGPVLAAIHEGEIRRGKSHTVIMNAFQHIQQGMQTRERFDPLGMQGREHLAFPSAMPSIHKPRAELEMSLVVDEIRNQSCQIQEEVRNQSRQLQARVDFSKIFEAIEQIKNSTDLSPVLTAIRQNRTDVDISPVLAAVGRIPTHVDFAPIFSEIERHKTHVDLSPMLHAIERCRTSMVEVSEKNKHETLSPFLEATEKTTNEIHQLGLNIEAIKRISLPPIASAIRDSRPPSVDIAPIIHELRDIRAHQLVEIDFGPIVRELRDMRSHQAPPVDLSPIVSEVHKLAVLPPVDLSPILAEIQRLAAMPPVGLSTILTEVQRLASMPHVASSTILAEVQRLAAMPPVDLSPILAEVQKIRDQKVDFSPVSREIQAVLKAVQLRTVDVDLTPIITAIHDIMAGKALCSTQIPASNFYSEHHAREHARDGPKSHRAASRSSKGDAHAY